MKYISDYQVVHMHMSLENHSFFQFSNHVIDSKNLRETTTTKKESCRRNCDVVEKQKMTGKKLQHFSSENMTISNFFFSFSLFISNLQLTIDDH